MEGTIIYKSGAGVGGVIPEEPETPETPENTDVQEGGGDGGSL